MSVEGWAEELVVASEFGLLEFAGVVIEFPDENAVVADGQLFHLPPQLQDLLPLAPHQVTHHSQVRFSGVFQVATDSQFGTLPERQQRDQLCRSCSYSEEVQISHIHTQLNIASVDL